MKQSENGYWVSFEFDNDMIGTWADYASSSDEFIANLLKMEKGNRIKRFIELHLDERDGQHVIFHMRKSTFVSTTKN